MSADIIQFVKENNMKPGTVVTLRSGGPNMTVREIKNNKIVCYWINDDGSFGRDEYERWVLHVLLPVPIIKNGSWTNSIGY